MEQYAECHGHIFMDGQNYKTAMAQHRNGVDREQIRARLAALQAAGVTYYRDGGDILGAAAYAREVAPDYGIEFRACLFGTHRRGQYGGIVGYAFDTAEEFAALVRRAEAERADFIKLMVSGIMDFQRVGGLTGGGLMGGGSPRDELAALVELAHGAGFAVMSHVNGADAVRAAVDAGVDSVEHGYFLDEDCLRRMAARGTIWTPTLAATAGFVGREGFGAGVAAGNLLGQGAMLRRAAELGVLIAAGSDAGAFGVAPDRGIHTEHALLAAAGIAPELIAAGDAAVQARFRRS